MRADRRRKELIAEKVEPELAYLARRGHIHVVNRSRSIHRLDEAFDVIEVIYHATVFASWLRRWITGSSVKRIMLGVDKMCAATLNFLLFFEHADNFCEASIFYLDIEDNQRKGRGSVGRSSRPELLLRGLTRKNRLYEPLEELEIKG